jgi:hypothetical protein
VGSSSRERADAEARAKFAAESAARDAKLKAQQAAQESAPVPVRPNSQGMTNALVPTMSTRQRAELATLTVEDSVKVVKPQASVSSSTGSHRKDEWR